MIVSVNVTASCSICRLTPDLQKGVQRMRKVLSAFLVASVLLLCAAPVFCVAATAPFTFNTSQSQPASDSTHWNYVVAHDDSDGVLISLESTALQYASFTSSFAGLLFNAPDIPSVAFKCSQTGTYQVNLSFYDLSNGYLLTTETSSVTVSGSNFIWYPNRIFALNSYVDFPVYCFALGSSACSWSTNSGYNEVEPFVNWNYSPPDPGPSPDPVDPTSVIRSLIPRPLGTSCTFYIADHVNLFSIFVGVPQQFETNGYISSDDSNHYYSDNYNVFDLTFSSSGSSLNFSIKNRAEFSYNVIITKYGVVDGSFVSSSSHAVTAATNATTPAVSNFSVSLSDPSTYGIYQSGFFARSHSISYPELRISWSDTIDYSLDLFVISQGLVTIVENQTSIISGISSANSTLTSISSTASYILSSLQAFYSLVDSNWTWFKTTFYNNLNNKWDITNQYLLAIYNLLNETDETMTIEDDTSGVAAMESAKNDLVVTNAAGQTVDAGDAAAAGLSQAAQQIGEIAQPVSTINQLMQSIVFDKPKLLLPVIVALGLGLMVTILGKNKSD